MKNVAQYENLLEHLLLSRDEDIFVGLLIQLKETSRFIISKVESITNDFNNSSEKLVLLRQPDIRGKMISENPVRLKDIRNIRVYKQLQGVNAHS